MPMEEIISSQSSGISSMDLSDVSVAEAVSCVQNSSETGPQDNVVQAGVQHGVVLVVDDSGEGPAGNDLIAML